MAEVKVYFENHKQIIYDELSQAESNVYIAVAWINFKYYHSIFDELLDRNIQLNIICTDSRQNRAHIPIIDKLKDRGAKIRLLNMPNKSNHMHHKFVIIDSQTIINGSFNWSPNAEKNFENIIVIKNATDQAKAFRTEYRRLLNITPSTIKVLQNRPKCPEEDCNGHLYNILVLSERTTKYYETYGDIVSICDECCEYEKVEECINDPQIKLYIDELYFVDDEYEIEYKYDMLTRHMEQYQNNKPVIHAIGKVNTTLNGWDEESISTDILWKNNFVGDNIPDSFPDEDFGVLYDSSETI